MENQDYYAKSTREKSPKHFYGLVMLGCGALMLIYAIMLLSHAAEFIDGVNNEDIDTLLNYGPGVLIGLVLFFISVQYLLKCLNALKRITISPNDPPEFKNYMEIANSMKVGKLSVYGIPTFGPLKFAYNYLSDRVPYLKPSQRKVVAMNVSFLNKFIVLLIAIFLLYLAQAYIPEEVLIEMSIAQSPFEIPIFLLIILLVTIALSFYTIFALIPDKIPKQEISEKIVNINGGGDPNQFTSILESSLHHFKNDNLPNRVFKSGFQKIEELSFNETGSFEGVVILETHPKYKGSGQLDVVSGVYLGIGLILVLISLVYFDVVSFSHNGGVANFDSIVSLFSGIILFSTGSRFFERASILLDSFIYESLFALVEVEGTIGKTEITAGRAITDSIKSKNVVIRSDAQLKLFVTKMQSENAKVSANRFVSAMVRDQEVQDATEALFLSISNIRDEGVSIRGVNIYSEAISSLTEANIKIEGAKTSLANKNPVLETPDVNAIETHKQKSLETYEIRNIESAEEPETKECPQCAETVKYKAKICRFCRFEF